MVLETREIGGAAPEEEQDKETPEPRDLKPEYCHYRDGGCDYARSCL